ncbi:preprotein translocase subunit YajC [Lichenicoccus sp.]|uniref:preprotein translocase subunit YajC n=1 Tax=Lichenicoccus sp. TaxID=2781899 RepID=UPI003D112539
MHLFATEAYAQNAIGGTAGGGAGLLGGLAGIGQFLPIVLIFIVFYFLLIRPQQQRQKSLKTMVASLKRGDRVVTAGGIVGVVQKVREGSNEIEVEIAPNVRVQILRDTISSVVKPPGAANDSVPAATK